MKVNCPGKAATVDKTAKVESNGKGVPNKTVKFQVCKAVKEDGAPAGTERMSAILNKRCQIYYYVDTMASKAW